MATTKDMPLYIPGEQVATLLFTKKGDIDPDTGKAEEITVMWMEVKADLTFDDRAKLFWGEEDLTDRLDAEGNPMLDSEGKPMKQPLSDEDVWERLAPFVLNWSVGERDAKGNAHPVPPPAEGGPDQFRLIHPSYVAKLLADLRYRSAGQVSTDFLSR